MAMQEDADKSKVDLDFLLKKYGFAKRQESNPDDEEEDDTGGFIVRFRLSRAYKALQRQEREVSKVNIPWKKIKKKIPKPEVDETQKKVKVSEEHGTNNGDGKKSKSDHGKRRVDKDENMKTVKQGEKLNRSNSPKRVASARKDKKHSVAQKNVPKQQTKRCPSQSPDRKKGDRKGLRNSSPRAESRLKTSSTRDKSSSPNRRDKNTANSSTPRKRNVNGKQDYKKGHKFREGSAKRSTDKKHQSHKIPEIKTSLAEPKVSSRDILEHMKRDSIVISDWIPEAITGSTGSNQARKTWTNLRVSRPQSAISKVSQLSKISKSSSTSGQSLSYFLPNEDDLFNEDASSNFGGSKSNEDTTMDNQDKKKSTRIQTIARYLYTLCDCQNVGKRNTLSKLQEKVKVSGVIQVYGCPSQEEEKSNGVIECPFCTVFPRKKIHSWMDCIPEDIDRSRPALFDRPITARTPKAPLTLYNRLKTARSERSQPDSAGRSPPGDTSKSKGSPPYTTEKSGRSPPYHTTRSERSPPDNNRPKTARNPSPKQYLTPTIGNTLQIPKYIPQKARTFKNPLRSDTFNPLSTSCWM